MAQSRGSSGAQRSEFSAIQAGFDSISKQFGGSTNPIIVSGADGGSINAYTITPTTAIAAYSAKSLFLFSPVITNTGPVTMNVSVLGAVALNSVANVPLVPNDLVAGCTYVAEFNGVNMVLIGPTKNYIDQTAFNTAVPSQPGDTIPRYLRTLNGGASWASLAISRSSRTSNVALGLSDNGNFIDIISGTFSQSFGSVSSGWYCFLRNSGSGDITIPSSDGLTNWIMYPNESRLFVYDGANYYSIILCGFQRTWTTTGAFTKPPGYSSFFMEPVAGGGGGGSGRAAAAGVSAGGGGGGGGARNPKMVQASMVPSSLTVTIGSAGTGGASVNSTSNGIAGISGGNTSIGTLALAFGGAGGSRGTSGAGVVGGGGGGGISAGALAVGGAPLFLINTVNSFSTGGSVSLNTGGNGGYSENGGAAGGGVSSDSTIVGAGGSSLNSSCGAGAGGSIDASNNVYNGGAGGILGNVTPGGGGSAGISAAGAAGGNGGNGPSAGGAGGGGGSGSIGGNGGNGGSPGDGGGGGGCGTTSSGAGGNGQAGKATITGAQ